MKKGDYIKQEVDELLTGEICYEDCEVFKTYFQLKALCFKKELKGEYLSYKQANRAYSEEVLTKLINEEYVFRLLKEGKDCLIIPSITENVDGILDYSLLNSIRGKISGVKKKIKILTDNGENTGELENELKDLQLRLIEEKDVVNTRSNTCLTIKNKIKENKIIEDKLRLNNNKEHKLTREEIEIEIRKHQPKNDLPF